MTAEWDGKYAMIHRTNARTLADGCLAPGCGKSETYCDANKYLREGESCCPKCRHPE